MKVGDKVSFRPALYGSKRTVTGTVVFIPKNGRYARVRFFGTGFYGRRVEHFESLQIVDGRTKDEEPETRGRDK